MESQALWLTLRLAASTTLILLAIAIPLAWWFAQRASTSRALVQAAIALPLVLPPTVIGFYLLVGLGPETAPGRLLIHLLGHPLAFSFAGLVVGSTIYSLPFAVMPLVAGFQSIGQEFAEAAALLGAGPWRAFLTVTLPLARPALLSSAVLVFLHTIGEFGVVLMVGGNIPGVTRTLSISIFDLVEDGRYAEAGHLSLVLIAIAAVGLALVYIRRPRLGGQFA
jgi:molybdate transport system permease protein